jgi:hypothetical protein
MHALNFSLAGGGPGPEAVYLCLIFYALKFFILFFKIPVYKPSADFSDWFRLKGKSRKTFDIVSIKYGFHLISILEDYKPAALLPLSVCACIPKT